MIRAHVTDDFYGGSVRIFIVQHPAEGSAQARYILRLGADGARAMEEVAEAHVVTDPTLCLGDDEARALLDALMRYYHGAEDTRALRRDYDDERKRVDRLATTLGDVVKALVNEP